MNASAKSLNTVQIDTTNIQFIRNYEALLALVRKFDFVVLGTPASYCNLRLDYFSQRTACKTFYFPVLGINFTLWTSGDSLTGDGRLSFHAYRKLTKSLWNETIPVPQSQLFLAEVALHLELNPGCIARNADQVQRLDEYLNLDPLHYSEAKTIFTAAADVASAYRRLHQPAPETAESFAVDGSLFSYNSGAFA